MTILGAVQVPHPPLILPEVGHGEEKRIQSTIDAFERAAKFIADLQPDTVIISSPHSILYSDYFHISPGASAKGTMAQFGAPQVKFTVVYDEELSARLMLRQNRLASKPAPWATGSRSWITEPWCLCISLPGIAKPAKSYDWPFPVFP